MNRKLVLILVLSLTLTVALFCGMVFYTNELYKELQTTLQIIQICDDLQNQSIDNLYDKVEKLQRIQETDFAVFTKGYNAKLDEKGLLK